MKKFLKTLGKSFRTILNIVLGVFALMFMISFIITLKWHFLVLAGLMGVIYGLILLLSCSNEAIQKEYILAQSQINHDMPIEINEKKVIRSYLAILSFLWIFPYIVGILSCSPHLGVMVYMPAMVLFFVVAGILEKYLDVFPFKKSTYRLINFGVHTMFTVTSFVYFFIRLS